MFLGPSHCTHGLLPFTLALCAEVLHCARSAWQAESGWGVNPDYAVFTAVPLIRSTHPVCVDCIHSNKDYIPHDHSSFPNDTNCMIRLIPTTRRARKHLFACLFCILDHWCLFTQNGASLQDSSPTAVSPPAPPPVPRPACGGEAVCGQPHWSSGAQC